MNKLMKKMFLSLLIAVGLCCIIPGSHVQAKSKVSYTYTTTTKKYKATDGQVVLKATYKGVKFKGSSAAVKKMNQAIAKDRKQFFDGVKSNVSAERDNYNSWKKYPGYNTNYSPSWMKVTSKVTCNKKGIVSVKASYSDYSFGAVHGYFFTYGMTFKIKSGKKLTLNQVIKGSNSSDKQKLVAAFQKMQEKEDIYWESALDTVQDTDMSTASYYLTSKNAVVCYSPYTLAFYAAGETYIKIPHAYR